jgi:ribonuclease BN (tRNA processing enzyme)
VKRRIHLLALLTIVACNTVAIASPDGGPHSEIVLLGTGEPEPNPDRFGPATAIVVNGSTYLFDAGAGVVRRMAAAQRSGASVDPRNIKAVFLTHLHSDHTIGLPDVILGTPRKVPLPLYGPAGTQKMVKSILEAYKQDIYVRTHGLQHQDPVEDEVNARDIPGEFVYRDDNLTIMSFEVRHGSWPHAFGYRIQAPDRTIVISGDTSPAESIVKNCNHCDVLIHEVYPDKGFATLSPEKQKYFASFHTSASELAKIASRAQPKLLIFYHQMFMHQDEDEIVREVRSGYAGKVVSGRDLDRY